MSVANTCIQTIIVLRNSLGLLLLAGFINAAGDQKTVPILERVARSLPDRDPNWRLIHNESYARSDGSSQASLRWSNGSTEVGATLILHRTLMAAKDAFKPAYKGDPHEDFRIPGIGDRAYLWPPKAPEGGGYNLRFRKGNVEVWIGAESEEVVTRCARYIAAAIPSGGLSRLAYQDK
jgi:hypothetical protein